MKEVKYIILGALLVLNACTENLEQDSQESREVNNNTAPDPSLVLKNGESYSPYTGRKYPTDVYFGDTHLHTSISLDAFGDGNTKVGPDEAYRWAKMIEEGKLASHVFSEFIYDATGNKPRLVEPEFEMSVWNTIIDAAEKHNEPGKFTALIGYEWSAFPNGNNLHRVVVFKNGKEKTSQVKPFSAFDSENPEDLWKYLEDYETKTGGSVLAIPHNGNISGGRMFSLQDFNENPITEEYAKTRMRWEPIYEVTQYKGDGETHPYLSPNDEFADFETWDKANLAMMEPHLDEYYETEYARSGLKIGLNQATQLGVNPFKFGMIGSTDSHTGFPQVAEDNFLGKYGSASPNPNNKNRWKKEWPPVEGTVAKMYGWESQSAGYAAVWATENTREAIWDAMKRKEVYATTGPRLVVRMFGGFDFKEEDANNHNIADLGYSKGVPMGGDLSNAPENKSATFLISATKDPEGANLDRIQIIKGWIDNDGILQERIFDVAVSDGRRITNGKTSEKVISTVDVSTATYSNSIGDAYLSVTWVDPDFDANQKSFYYARVIEIPTPRWTAYDQVRFGIKMGPEVPMQIQERAYTSPIWYTPG